jgi:hypothetical protein
MVVVSEQTRKSQRTFLTRLQKKFGAKDEHDLSFLTDYKTVIAWIDTLKTSTDKPLSTGTKKTYFTMIKSMLRDSNDDRFKRVMQFYTDKMMAAKELSEEENKKQELTEDEKAKWLGWSDILDVQPKVKKIADKAGTWRSYQDYVIICLYTMIAPKRLDYSPMKFVDKAPIKKKDDKENYCVLLSDRAYFILNSYKTAHIYGLAEYDATPALFAVLKKWRQDFNDGEWLLVMPTDPAKPMSFVGLGQAVTRIMETNTGKKVTVNIFRHSYISMMRKCEMRLLDKEKLAKDMLHNTFIAERYIRYTL